MNEGYQFGSLHSLIERNAFVYIKLLQAAADAVLANDIVATL